MTRRLLIATALLLVAGCGIQPTSVVDAGSAPSMYKFGGNRMSLYFLHDGRLEAVQRSSIPEVTPQSTLAALFQGPTPEEAAAGFSSLLPGEPVVPTVDTTATPVAVHVPAPLPDNVPARINQVACTAIAALVADGHPVAGTGVDVIAVGATYRNKICDIP
ncbi:hypothetical protein LZ318_24415 [Saccharopolyspora indica]|uniref:hypothetical protein n=1 Tax=Saccharopolyspora indica TaxID=1229659 RepID=UPI0022EB376C|nr:hypothetical protein [Saccharopolyspora indica]MDA3644780.1 hypothetical protein [Saccharopolyspora indica]